MSEWNLGARSREEAIRRAFRLSSLGLGLIREGGGPTVVMLLLLTVVQGAAAPWGVWITARLVDSALVRNIALNEFLGLLGVWGAVQIAANLAGVWATLLSGRVNDRVTALLQSTIIERTTAIPSIEPFEDPRFHSRLHVLNRDSRFRPLNFLNGGLDFCKAVIAGGGLLMLTISGWAPTPLVLVACTWPLIRVRSRIERVSFAAVTGMNELALKAQYCAAVSADPGAAKEVRLFPSLGGYLIKRFVRLYDLFHKEMAANRLRFTIESLPANVLFLSGNLLVFGMAIWRASQGRIDAGSLVVVIQVLAQFQSILERVSHNVASMSGHLAYFALLDDLLSYRDRMLLGTRQPPKYLPPIIFENVAFVYPNGRCGVRDLSLVLRPNERTALVGPNGAGKSTMAKLLLRLYDPSGGRILVGDDVLSEMDVALWRARVSAMFQDFGRYAFNLEDNIALGSSADVPSAVAMAGLTETVERLPDGLGTQLGTHFGGTDLSGGEWQKVALARQYARAAEADLLLFDEPTSSLDATSEQHLLQALLDRPPERRMLVIISHKMRQMERFDNIVVLDAGRVVDQGRHDALMRRCRTYSELFRAANPSCHTTIDHHAESDSIT